MEIESWDILINGSILNREVIELMMNFNKKINDEYLISKFFKIYFNNFKNLIKFKMNYFLK